MSERTIFIRNWAHHFSVVIKGGKSIPGANDTFIPSYAEAVEYAGKLKEQYGFPVVDETPVEAR